MLFSFYFVAYAARASAAPSFLTVLAAMTRRTLTATLTRPETGAPPPTIAQIRLPAASTRLMTAKTSAGCALLGSFAARRARIPSAREKQAKPTYKSSSLNIGHIYTCSDIKVSSKCIWEKKLFRRIEICYNISVQTLVGAIIGAIEKHLKSHDLRCFSWQREKDSNPHIRSQSPLCYLYTIPLNAKSIIQTFSNLSSIRRKLFL